MSVRQRGLGRGLGALIAPSETTVVPAASVASGLGGATTDSGPRPRGRRALGTSSPSDVFFRPTDTHEPHRETPTPAPAQEPAGTVVGELRLVPVAAIEPNPRQPRTEFDETALEELTESIREVGVLQPVVVRRTGPERYELVMGERRWRASQAAGLLEIPAVVRETPDDDLLRDALLENLHRSELNPLEEAAAYNQLLDDFGCTHDVLAARLGKSRSHLTNTMRLLGLSPTVQRRVAAGVLSAGHARALLGLEDPEAQDALASRIVAEGLSVRAVEELVAVAAPRHRRRPKPNGTGASDRPELSDVEAALADRLDTRVKVVMGRSKGRITVEFAGVEDLQRIVAAMAPGPTAA